MPLPTWQSRVAHLAPSPNHCHAANVCPTGWPMGWWAVISKSLSNHTPPPFSGLVWEPSIHTQCITHQLEINRSMAKPLMIFVNDSSIIIKKLWGKWSDFMGNLSSMWQRWPGYNQWPSCSEDLNDLDDMDELVSSPPIFWYCILSTRTPPISLLLLIRIEKALWCFWFGSFP